MSSPRIPVPVTAARRPASAGYAAATTRRTAGRGEADVSRDLVSRLPVVCSLAILLVLFLAYFEGWVGDALTLAIFGLAAVIAIRAAVALADWLNSLTVLLILCLIRFGVPGLSLFDANWAGPTDSYAEAFAISQPEAVYGVHLAAIGVLAVILGWYVSPGWLVPPLAWVYRQASRMRADARLVPVAIGVIGVGILAALVNLTLSFGDPLGAAISGVARGSGSPGSARYGFLAIAALSTSSVILALYLAHQTRKSMAWILLPAVVATAVLTVFGGRVNALTPLGISFLGAYYVRRRRFRATGRSSQRFTPKRVTAIASVIVLLAVYVIFVPSYRGESGVSAISQATDPGHVGDYIERTPWTEVGLLHSYALAGRLGSGSMDGSSYPALLGLPGELLGLEAERPGEVLVQRLRPGNSPSEFGVHTGLVADVFLNTGLIAAVLAGIAFGILVRAEYAAFRLARATLGTALVHGLALWISVWMFFGFMGNVNLPLQVAPVVIAIIGAAYLLPRRLE